MTKEPMYVHCGECDHEWVCAYLPMPIPKLTPLMKAPCPMCGSKTVLHGQIPKPTRTGDVEAWVGNGDTGTSSLTIWAVLMRRHSPHGHFDAPRDLAGPRTCGTCRFYGKGPWDGACLNPRAPRGIHLGPKLPVTFGCNLAAPAGEREGA